MDGDNPGVRAELADAPLLENATRRFDLGSFDNLGKTLQGFAPDSAEYAQRMRALKKMMIDYKAWVAVERENMTDEHRAWIERTYAAVMEGIAAVARHNGIQVVVTREELETSVPETETLLKQILNRKVVYADPELDLTDAVLVTLNDLFAKKGGAKSIKFGQ